MLQSTNLIFSPSLRTAIALDIIVKFGIITSSPFFNFNDFIAISNAAVPLDTATEYLLPMNLKNYSQIF